jgi:hypothetical protein
MLKNILIIILVMSSCSHKEMKTRKDCDDICYPQRISWQQEKHQCVCRPEVR